MLGITLSKSKTHSLTSHAVFACALSHTPTESTVPEKLTLMLAHRDALMLFSFTAQYHTYMFIIMSLFI